jgi:hypothetical protein
MFRIALPAFAASLLALSLIPYPAQAQTRVFVAAQGADSNPCTFAAPCRTFQHAHDVVAAGSEIDVLDPAGYGALTISKAISIQGHGFSGISVTSNGTGITINAGPTDAVNLNGLLIEGSGIGGTGITFNSGKSLIVLNCVVRNLIVGGLQFFSNATTLETLSVANSYFSDIQIDAMLVQTNSSGAVTAAIDHVAFYSNHHAGIAVTGSSGGTGSINVAVTDSAAGNNGVGFDAASDVNQSSAILTLTRTSIVNNGTGVEASGASVTLRLAGSTLAGNTIGYFATSGSLIQSYGDNYIDGNGSNGGTLIPIARQ